MIRSSLLLLLAVLVSRAADAGIYDGPADVLLLSIGQSVDAQPPPPPPLPSPPPASGGGSLSWLALLALGLFGAR